MNPFKETNQIPLYRRSKVISSRKLSHRVDFSPVMSDFVLVVSDRLDID